jgi:hypothetical protein
LIDNESFAELESIQPHIFKFYTEFKQA